MTMQRAETTLSRVSRIVTRSLHLDVPGENASLFDTGGLDSLMFVELLVLLEQEFAIRISIEETDLDDFRTLVQIARLVDRLRNAGPKEGDTCPQITPLPHPA